MIAVRGIRAFALALLAAIVLLLPIASGAISPASAAAPLGFVGISGEVTDATSGLPIANVPVYLDGRANPPQLTDADGWFGFDETTYGLVDGDSYAVIILGDASHMGDDSVSVSYSTTVPPSPVAVALAEGQMFTGTVTVAQDPLNPAAPIGVPDVLVLAGSLDPTATAGPYFDLLGPTDGSGQYVITVPPGDSYALLAVDTTNTYDSQIYSDISFYAASLCGCLDPTPVAAPLHPTTITTIDFALRLYSDWFYVSARAQHVDLSPYAGASFQLEQKDTNGVWQLVDTDDVDADGYADLFGFGPAEYRLLYTIGGVSRPAASFDDNGFGGTAFETGNRGIHIDAVVLGGCTCGGGFTEADIDVRFTDPSGSGGGPVTPRRPRTPTSSVTLPFALPTATPTPTPTPTSTPSPSSSPSESPSASPTATPDPAPADNAFGLWWLWVLLLLIVALIVFFIVRATLRR